MAESSAGKPDYFTRKEISGMAEKGIPWNVLNAILGA